MVNRARWDEMSSSTKTESNFDKSARERKEHADEAKRKQPEIKPTSTREPFQPKKGGILRVDKALYDAGVD